MRDQDRHFSIIGTFILLGVSALIPASYFSGRLFAARSEYPARNSLLITVLANPSTFFSLAMLLAGLLVWRRGLLGKELQSSFGRLFGATLVAAFAYPAGFLFILWTVFALTGLWDAFGFDHANTGPKQDWIVLLRAVPFASVLCVGGAFVVLLAALALAVAVRYWPRRIWGWAFGVSAISIAGTIIGAVIQHKFLFPTIPARNFLVNSTLDLFLAMAWNLQLPILIGAPILAGLLGHWIYCAAQEYAGAPAE